MLLTKLRYRRRRDRSIKLSGHWSYPLSYSALVFVSAPMGEPFT